METDTILKFVALLFSFAAISKAIHEYIKAQKWKKAEFVAKEVKEFNSSYEVIEVMKLLDLVEYEFTNTNKPFEGWILKDTDNYLKKAFDVSKMNEDTLSDHQLFTRDIFDCFFDYLLMFNNYIDTKLITVKDIKPYLHYWIDILANPENTQKTDATRNRMWDYIDKYGYKGVRSLCAKFGYKNF